MAELAGNLVEIYIHTAQMATTGDGTKITGLNQSTLRRLAEILDHTQFGSTHRKRVAGIKDISLDLSGFYDPADAGQLLIEEGDTVWIAYMPQGAGSPGTQGQFIVESVEQSAAADGDQELSVTLQGAGAAPDVINT